MEVLCIGHAAYDVVLPLSQYPEEDQKYALETKLECGGGPAANAAYLLSKWGIETAFMGQVGQDVYGTSIVRELKDNGVHLGLLQINPKTPTPYSVILVNQQNGSRTIFNVRQPSTPLTTINQLQVLPAPRVLLMDGHEPEASLKALEMYPQALSILDAGSLKPATLALAERVNFLIASSAFALDFCQVNSLASVSDVLACLEKIQQLGKAQVVVTQGEQGLVYLKESSVVNMSAYPVNAVDTTGAGDVFHGAFAYGLLQGFTLEDNLRFSSAASALSVQAAGARTSIPELAQVQRYIEEKEGFTDESYF